MQNDLEFQNQFFLIGLIVIIPLAILYLWRINKRNRKIKLIGNVQILKNSLAEYSPQKSILKAVFILLAIILLIVGAANLRKPALSNNAKSTGIDIMIALDVSKSMLAKDEPPTRLLASKEFLYQLLNKLHNNRIGLVVFAGKAYLQMPISSDWQAANMFISNANPNWVNFQGTSIGEALSLCNRSLDTKEKKYKAVILITDGEDHESSSIEAAKELADDGVIVHTIGVGSIGGVPFSESENNNYKRDINGQTVISKLNESLLQQISTITGGTYHLLKDKNASNQILSNILSTEQKEIKSNSLFKNYHSFYYLFLALAIIILVFEIFISNKKKALANSTIFVYLILLFPSMVFGQKAEVPSISKANELYKKGEYKKAAETYLMLIKKNKNDYVAIYNLANSLYKNKQYNESSKQLADLINKTKNPQLKATFLYNLGMAAIKEKKWNEAESCFKKSLLLNQNDNDARENLQRVYDQLANNSKSSRKIPDSTSQQNPNNKQQHNTKQSDAQLNMLREQEKNLQKELQLKKYNPSSSNEKDW